ncbi:MAG: ATP phosphoribosyltransferase regulatory subunit [Gammaproteobacteria bacterium]|jgi:ATP phosphoribosyltransferase regulatory subunit|nr:ATP phosphoribosyltransferase regulatory subunit [Gammaproteobacteria bacterium]MCH2578443.1 ATP phosphoribosyltransferase regulatory subunit [Pseudomonadales bacterium]MED5529662.1 ATP phosphoribosyltransferase regulatory subunit [Pseudomonadota bacterium]HAI16318.1 ATP phosphoribosyltransferase regulatory subunit [Gammaproteobacteria bacterium]HBX98804.1 ATP phosphoribosyltransferase regulatory subunit [Gammaproteobacteria bacterium]|tara:strand:- start:2220 stop:3410 length:1191 start_codon:yes stop_codon:yes gene_type:complete
MTSAKRWLLPDGVEEILPAEAYKLESLRRHLLDLYESWGYQLVITPLIEYLDSLLVGSSTDLDLHTFKITDQLSGRMMGIRADITPQAARIDAHCLNREGPVRLCYADNVLHTRPRGIMTSRVPIRIGAELYGYSGVECDIELVCIMHETLRAAEINDVHIVLGHVGIFRTLLLEANLDEGTERSLFEAVQRKEYDRIDEVLNSSVIDKELRQMLEQLTRLSGDETILEAAKQVFAAAPVTVTAELDELVAIAEGIKKRLPEAAMFFDLCELRGYEYHTGIVFAAYTPNYGRAVAKGGRYDHIGEVFGRARPASGFDSDLKVLAKLSNKIFKRRAAIVVPNNNDPDLLILVDTLREQGEIVVNWFGDAELSQQDCEEQNCDRQIVNRNGEWVVESL